MSARLVLGDGLGWVRAADVTAAGKDGAAAAVVARWGEGAARSRAVTALALADASADEAVLACVGRADGSVEARSMRDGSCVGSVVAAVTAAAVGVAEAEAAAAAASAKALSLSAELKLLRVTAGGQASVHSSGDGGESWAERSAWTAASSGGGPGGKGAPLPVGGAAFSADGSRLAVGGPQQDLTVWDVSTASVAHKSKPPPLDMLGMRILPATTSLAFIDETRVALGGFKELRVYDFARQRRAVLTLPFGEGPVTTLAVSPDGSGLYAGNTRGQVGRLDLASGRIDGAFKGCSGSIRSIACHPSEPLVAVCGLDRHARIYSARTRALAAEVYAKQELTACAWDTWTLAKQEQKEEAGDGAEAPADGGEETRKKKKQNKSTNETEEEAGDDDEDDDDEALLQQKMAVAKKKKATGAGEKTKKKKRSAQTADADAARAKRAKQVRA